MDQQQTSQAVRPDDRPCSKCGDEPRRAGQRYGARCHAAAQRASRARVAEQAERSVQRRIEEAVAAALASVEGGRGRRR